MYNGEIIKEIVMKNKYTFVDSKKLKVLEALMSGHTLNVGDESYRYIYKDNVVSVDESKNEERVATETQLFTRYGEKENSLWIGLTSDLGMIMSVISKANHQEVSAIIQNLAFDMEKREKTAHRHISLLSQEFKKDPSALKSFILSLFDNEPKHSDSVFVHGIYKRLQSDNSFPMSFETFLSEVYVAEDNSDYGLVKDMYRMAESLCKEGILQEVSVFADATPHFKKV